MDPWNFGIRIGKEGDKRERRKKKVGRRRRRKEEEEKEEEEEELKVTRPDTRHKMRLQGFSRQLT